MTRRPWLYGVVALALLLSGCGIPDRTSVVTLGPGPALGNSSDSSSAPEQHLREDAVEKSQFVRYFLEAAAGDPDGALKRVKAFLSPSAAGAFKAPTEIRVIHLVDDPLNNPGSDDVVLRYQVIGSLGHSGTLDPSSDGRVEKTTLVVGSLSGRSGLFVQQTPSAMMITDTALASYFQQRTIYWWNTEHTGLVPDIRYMPKEVPAEQQPTKILNWLLGGPAGWLLDAVDPLPENTALVGNVPAVSDGKLQINLTDQAVPTDDPRALDRLRRQLQWSLRPLLPKTLELRIGRADPNVYSDNDYLSSNLAIRLNEAPERFVVYDGRIRRLAGLAAPSVPLPVLTAADNKGVLSAALSNSGGDDFAAVVHDDGNGKQSLRIGRARPGEQSPLKATTLTAPIGHPSWAVTTSDTHNASIGLVTANGKLYGFHADGDVQRIDWANAPPGMTSVSIAPDGHRVAILAGGKIYLSVVTTSGDDIQLGDVRPIPTLLLTAITALDWSSEGWLAVAGTVPDRNRVTVMDLSIDGAQKYNRVGELGDEQVTYLSAYPANPTATLDHSDSVSYMAGGDSYDALQGLLKITVSSLAEPVAKPPAGVVPTAPFFRN